MPTVAVGDVELYYERVGRGPPLLLIAGIPGTVRDWFPFADRLAASFTVVVFDNRGSGRSDKPEGHYSIAGFADDAAGLVDALDLGTPHVFGVSMGGMIAQEFAIEHADSVDRLVLGCTHCGGDRVVQPAEAVDEAFGYDGDDWGHRIELLAPHAFAPGFPGLNPEAYDAFVGQKTADEQPLAAYRRQIGAVVRHDAADRLDRIDAPTLVLTGTDDSIIPAENSDTLVDRIPGARLATIPDAGHLFFVEKPDETAEILTSFLQGDK